ncbi:MAG TPA: hypothetical protein VI933_03780 [archaeon]|nr:hypothetical protein [archaeon]
MEIKEQFCSGIKKVLDVYPQERDGRLLWKLSGSGAWYALVLSSAVERLDAESLPLIIVDDIQRKDVIQWESIPPPRRIKDIDMIEYDGSNRNGNKIHIGNGFSLLPGSGQRVWKSDYVYIDAASAGSGYGRPVRCVIENGTNPIRIYTDSPEVNLAHKFVRAMQSDEREKYSRKALRDLQFMEPLSPLMKPAEFLEYLLDEIHQPNDFFGCIKKEGFKIERFRRLPEVWQEFIEETFMYPSGPGQRIANALGIIDLSFEQRAEYFSAAVHYTVKGVPFLGLKRYLHECHRKGEPIDYSILEGWCNFD